MSYVFFSNAIFNFIAESNFHRSLTFRANIKLALQPEETSDKLCKIGRAGVDDNELGCSHHEREI